MPDDKYKCKKCGVLLEDKDFTLTIVNGKEVDLQLECKCGFSAYSFISIEEMTEDEE